jgi:hypothetical protein
MAKLPKNHPTIIELEEQTELARINAKEHKAFIYSHIINHVNKHFSKHQNKTQKLIQELEIIASQKQGYGQ